MDKEAREQLVALLATPEHRITSLSQLFECLLFLLQGIYIENDETRFRKRIYEIAARRMTDIAKAGDGPELVTAHLTIDVDACAFMDFLKKRYRTLLGSRSKVATLIVYWTAQLCSNTRGLHYLARRLEHVRRAHATRR